MASQIHDSPLHNGEQNGEHKQQQQQEEEAARSSASGPESVVVVVDSPYFVASDAPQASKKRKLPAMLDHFNQRDLKNLFKCSIAVWINTILIFINPTLSVLGQAAFFGNIVLFIVPPAGILFIYILASLTLVLGLSLGWAWGVISMKAALATRPAADTNARLQQLAQLMPKNLTNVEQASGQSKWIRQQIFEGFMLDARVSVTYFCMIGLFVYLVARLRVRAPKLTLVSIFSMIISDIFLTLGPMLPSFSGTIGLSMFKPCVVAVGIGAVCNLLFFPQSTSSLVLDGMHNVMAPMPGFLDACLYNFKNPRSRMDLAKLMESKAQILGSYKALGPAAKFLPMDLSIGKWSSDDLTSLQLPFREVLVAFHNLLQIFISRSEHQLKDDKMVEEAETVYEEMTGEDRLPLGHHQLSRAADFRVRAKHPDSEAMLDASFHAMLQSSSAIVKKCQDGLAAIDDSFAQSRTSIIGSRKSKDAQQAMVESHARLVEELEQLETEFTSLTATLLKESHAHLLDETSKLKPQDGTHAPPILGLTLGLLFEERMLSLSKSLRGFLSIVVEIETKRSTARIWLPSKIRKLFTWALHKDGVPEMGGMSGETPKSLESDAESSISSSLEASPNEKGQQKDDEEDGSGNVASAQSQLDRMRRIRSRKRNKSSLVVLGIVKWLAGSEGSYALRVVIVTIALAIPAVIPSSSAFFYREKGLWAVIMGQLGIMPYSSDFTLSIIARISATTFGGLFGMVCWYIGAGSGDGNPYGMAAVMAVAIVLLMWTRMFGPPQWMQAWIMMAATVYLVMAYSWIDTHIPNYGNPGVGVSVFWRRLLLVLIGFAAAIVVMFLPRPPSANLHYRRLLAESLGGIKDRYALFAATWEDVPYDLRDVAEKEALAAAELLSAIAGPIKGTKLEFSTSNVDADTLELAHHITMGMNQAVGQLILYTSGLPAELRHEFVRGSGAAEERMIADVMAVMTMIQHSLRTGEAMPAVLPTPLIARWGTFAHESNMRRKQDGEEGYIWTRHLDEADTRKYASAVAALVHFLGSIDELVIVIKRAVGETSSFRMVETA